MATYYIDSVNGLDTNNGLSPATAFKTLQYYLNSVAITDNTTLYLMNGSYTCNAALATKAATSGITLTVIGKGLNTILTPSAPFGANAIVGTVGATLSINKLVLNMTSMGGTNVQFMNCHFNLNNVALTNIPTSSYATFLPGVATTVYTFRNCIAIGSNNLLLSTQANAANFKIYNCYGRFASGYSTSDANWNASNNVITTTPAVDAKYAITDGAVAVTVGVYGTGSTYRWNYGVLLKQDGQYYSFLQSNYNTTTKQYNVLATPDFTKADLIDSLFTAITVNGETFKPIDKFNNFQIVDSVLDQAYNIRGLKTTKELVVATGDINLALALNIDYLRLAFARSGNGKIKIAFSIDKGTVWKSFDGTNFTNLPITIPSKDYSTLTSEEIAQWQIAMNEIYTNGVSVEVFNTINFNLLNAATIRFAYVIERPTFADTAQNNQMEWQFDAKGSFKLMKPTEYDIDIYEGEIKVTSLIASDIMKVNVLV